MAKNVPESMREGKIELREDGSCIHLTDNNMCDIYETRPVACQVRAMRPVRLDEAMWFALNLVACDELHQQVYGTDRPIEVR